MTSTLLSWHWWYPALVLALLSILFFTRATRNWEDLANPLIGWFLAGLSIAFMLGHWL